METPYHIVLLYWWMEYEMSNTLMVLMYLLSSG